MFIDIWLTGKECKSCSGMAKVRLHLTSLSKLSTWKYKIWFNIHLLTLLVLFSVNQLVCANELGTWCVATKLKFILNWDVIIQTWTHVIFHEVISFTGSASFRATGQPWLHHAVTLSGPEGKTAYWCILIKWYNLIR